MYNSFFALRFNLIQHFSAVPCNPPPGYSHRAVTVFSSRKSLIEAIRLLAPPMNDFLLDPRGKKAYG